ncbi:hypothetical protein K1719_024409 [Acacia pycnantha]|nr:hypothetical protein K1719_024409 [Acacia pycnantha]
MLYYFHPLFASLPLYFHNGGFVMITPESLNNLCFSDHRKMLSLRWDGVSLKPSKAFRSEEGGDLKEKRYQNLKKHEVKLKRENGFWSFASSIISSTFKVGSKSVDDYRLALVKVGFD